MTWPKIAVFQGEVTSRRLGNAVVVNDGVQVGLGGAPNAHVHDGG